MKYIQQLDKTDCGAACLAMIASYFGKQLSIAKIKDPYLKTKTGQTARLIPGITAEGRIITERSTVMQMVLRKLDFISG